MGDIKKKMLWFFDFWNKNKTLHGPSTHYDYVNKMGKVNTVETDENQQCFL